MAKYFITEKTKGRPKLILSEEGKQMIEVLAKFMCTDEEIASELGVTVETLQNKNNGAAFLELKKKGRERGKASLRRKQFALAEKNASMAIWLGKQYLGQRDDMTVAVQEKNNLLESLLTDTKDVLSDDIPELE